MMLPPAVPEGQGNIASDDYPTVSANSTASVSHSNLAEDVRARSSFAGKQRIRQGMLSGPILSSLIKLGWPTMVVLTVQTLVGVAETYWVSYLGTAALAGVSLVFPISMLMTMMSNGGIGGGVSSAVARAIGSGRSKDANALVFHALILAVAFGLLFTAGILLAGPTLYSRPRWYGRCASLSGYLFHFCFRRCDSSVDYEFVGGSSSRGRQRARTSASIVDGSCNRGSSLSGVHFRFRPVPRFGIAGAGMAVIVYYGLAAIALVVYLASGKSGLMLKRGRIEARLFRDILSVGLISAIGTIQPNLAVVVATGVVGLFGADALAGYGIASRLDYVLIPIMFGIGTGVVTMVGTNMGAGNLVRAKRIAWTGAAVGFLVTEIIGMVVAVSPTLWLHLFSHDQRVISTGSLYLHIVGPMYGAVGIGMLLYFAAQGGGRVLWPFLAGTARLFIAAGIGWLLVAHWGFGLAALFITVTAALAISAAISVLATISGAIWRVAAE
jgi:Na+-driven multidrug efflux pump